MRRSLLWALACTVALSAISLIWPRTEATLVAAVVRDSPSPAVAAVAQASPPPDSTAELPTTLEPIVIEPALRDPFAPVAPPAPSLPAPAPKNLSPAPVVMAPVEVPVQISSMRARVLGTMVTPEGKRLVLMLVGETVSIAEVGALLDNGYVVQAVDRDVVRVVYPPTGTTTDLALRDPASETR